MLDVEQVGLLHADHEKLNQIICRHRLQGWPRTRRPLRHTMFRRTLQLPPSQTRIAINFTKVQFCQMLLISQELDVYSDSPSLSGCEDESSPSSIAVEVSQTRFYIFTAILNVRCQDIDHETLLNLLITPAKPSMHAAPITAAPNRSGTWVYRKVVKATTTEQYALVDGALTYEDPQVIVLSESEKITLHRATGQQFHFLFSFFAAESHLTFYRLIQRCLPTMSLFE